MSKNRSVCEIKLKVFFGLQSERPRPILIEGPNGIASIELAPGDGLFYRGVECAHWREPLDGEHTAQVFLNYVDQNGAHAEWKYDKRPGLAFKRPRPRGNPINLLME